MNFLTLYFKKNFDDELVKKWSEELKHVTDPDKKKELEHKIEVASKSYKTGIDFKF